MSSGRSKADFTNLHNWFCHIWNKFAQCTHLAQLDKSPRCVRDIPKTTQKPDLTIQHRKIEWRSRPTKSPFAASPIHRRLRVHYSTTITTWKWASCAHWTATLMIVWEYGCSVSCYMVSPCKTLLTKLLNTALSGVDLTNLFLSNFWPIWFLQREHTHTGERSDNNRSSIPWNTPNSQYA